MKKKRKNNRDRYVSSTDTISADDYEEEVGHQLGELPIGPRSPRGFFRVITRTRHDAALDVFDWVRVFGYRLVDKDSFREAFRLHPDNVPCDDSRPSAQFKCKCRVAQESHNRHWERLKQDLRERGVPHATADVVLPAPVSMFASAKVTLAVRMTGGSWEWANELIDARLWAWADRERWLVLVGEELPRPHRKTAEVVACPVAA